MAAHPRRGQFRILHGQRRQGADVFGGLLPGGRGRAVEIRPLAGKEAWVGEAPAGRRVAFCGARRAVFGRPVLPASDLSGGGDSRTQGARRAALPARGRDPHRHLPWLHDPNLPDEGYAPRFLLSRRGA